MRALLAILLTLVAGCAPAGTPEPTANIVPTATILPTATVDPCSPELVAAWKQSVGSISSDLADQIGAAAKGMTRIAAMSYELSATKLANDLRVIEPPECAKAAQADLQLGLDQWVIALQAFAADDLTAAKAAMSAATSALQSAAQEIRNL